MDRKLASRFSKFRSQWGRSCTVVRRVFVSVDLTIFNWNIQANNDRIDIHTFKPEWNDIWSMNWSTVKRLCYILFDRLVFEKIIIYILSIVIIIFLQIRFEVDIVVSNSCNQFDSTGINSLQPVHINGYWQRLIYFNHPQVIKVSFVDVSRWLALPSLSLLFFLFLSLSLDWLLGFSARPNYEVRDGATGY